MDWRNHIHSDPRIMVGKPVIKRTRITVELMLEKLAYQGIDEILLGYPHLTRPQIQAAVHYAAEVFHAATRPGRPQPLLA
jgi:uncharacterized protein (DUF433 family)